MGGRGSGFGKKSISNTSARMAYNSSKHFFENNSFFIDNEAKVSKELNAEINKNAKILSNGGEINMKHFDTSEKTRQQLDGAVIEARREIKNLGSAEALQKRPDLYYKYRAARDIQHNVNERYSKETEKEREKFIKENGPKRIENKTVTTTYDRARARRIKNFDEWFFSGR